MRDQSQRASRRQAIRCAREALELCRFLSTTFAPPTFQGIMQRASFVTCVLALIAIFAAPAPAATPVITHTDLYSLGTPAGFGYVDASGGNHRAAGGQVVGYGFGSATAYDDHALLWTPSTPSGIDLNPAGYTYSHAVGTSGSQQVGQGYGPTTGDNTHALLWTGSAASYVDLNPAGFTYSEAYATNGTQQVGQGYGPATGGSYQYHALLWNGSAASYVDLNPGGFTGSFAFGTNGTQQVGDGAVTATGGENHALLWHGSAASYVDLNPSGVTRSVAYGTSGKQQVGVGFGPATGDANHALLWTGSAESCVDLNPSGFTLSYATGTNGTQQIGYGTGPATGNNWHALLWSGTADSYIDLGALLPSDGDYAYANSYAISIEGDTVYGLAVDNTGEYYHAIEWNIVPEPGSLGLVALALLAWAGTRRKRSAALMPSCITSRIR